MEKMIIGVLLLGCFALMAFGMFVAYLGGLWRKRQLRRAGIQLPERKTYTNWGEVMLGIAFLWFSIMLFLKS
jgi:hypothetical protein